MRSPRSSPRSPEPPEPGPLSRWRLPPAGWRRTVALRRLLAGLLAVGAVVLALAPGAAPAGTPILVAARDLGPGTALAPADLVPRTFPDGLAPTGAVTDTADATGRMLVGGVRAGEPVTDVRLLGPAAARASTGRDDAAGVPLRLADPGVGELLHPGLRVDVVAVGGDGAPDQAVPGEPGEPGEGVVAGGAVVLAVLPPAERSTGGPVVVVSLPAAEAARVAATALSREVTVTLR